MTMSAQQQLDDNTSVIFGMQQRGAVGLNHTASPRYLARLFGMPVEAVAAALERLELGGLVAQAAPYRGNTQWYLTTEGTKVIVEQRSSLSSRS